MKKLLIILTILTCGIGINNVTHAQELSIKEVENSINKEGKYALFLSKAKRLKGAVITGEQLKEISPDIQFQIVMAGPILKDLVDSEKMMPLINRAEKAGVKMVACSIALKKLGIDEAELPEHVQVTSNAAIYLYGLQENGYLIL